MENTMMNTLDANEPKTPDSENPAFLLPETDDPEYNRNAKEYNINYCLKKIDEIGKETETIKGGFLYPARHGCLLGHTRGRLC